MIQSFEIKNPGKTHLKWLSQVPALEKPRKFEFKPGLNILWGKNGSGKSTVLTAIARLMHCEQSGQPCLTHHSVSTLKDNAPLTDLPGAMSLVHDGQGVRCFDPTVAVGLIGGMAGFDEDFFEMGVMNTMFKGSAGQTTMFRFDKIIGGILDGTVPELRRQVNRGPYNAKDLDVIDGFLAAQIEKGQPTVLLDEPERSFDLGAQVRIWRLIRAYSTSVQFIVASHSFFALDIPGANCIEMTPGYQVESLLALNALANWAKETPQQYPAEKLAALRKRK